MPTPGGIELLLRHAGSERILFGSGSTLRPIQPALNTVLDAEIEEQDKRRILGINALRFFGQPHEADQLEASATPLPVPKIPSTRAIDVHTHLGTIPGISATIRDLKAIDHFSNRYDMEYSICSSYVAYHEDLEAGNQEMLEAINGRPRLLGSPVISPTHLETSIRWLTVVPRIQNFPTPPTHHGDGSRRGRSRILHVAVRGRGQKAYPYLSQWSHLGRAPAFAVASGVQALPPSCAPLPLPTWRCSRDRTPPSGPAHYPRSRTGERRRRARQTTVELLSGAIGTYPDRGDVRRAIDGLARSWVVFGTDLDLIVPAFALGIYYEADLSAEEDRLIMAENARRILDLPGAD